jgi:GTP pyrophosphokinase
MKVERITDMISSYYPQGDVGIVREAYEFAHRAHEGQYRKSGDPYFTHPYKVAVILAELKADIISIASGLLHDVLEDTDISLERLKREFGPAIASIVEGVTKIREAARTYKSSRENQAENMRKMILATAQDVRVILVRLADRLHNMRTLTFMPEVKQQEKAIETMEIYAPIAHRLGIGLIKGELEDLSFRYLEPDAYRYVADRIRVKQKERKAFMDDTRIILEEHLGEAGIEARIEGRLKTLYSIYNKMKRQDKAIDEIYDLVGTRVITNTVGDCYAALGIVHSIWKPIAGRVKDFIAMPKSNGYQSLHTTVVGPGGNFLEVQIRTHQMDEMAERGVAAHWRYKEGRGGLSKDDYKFPWIKQALEWQEELHDPAEFLESVKIDLFYDEVFVFTPKGAVKELPAGSTPIDFAYSVHTEVGHNCAGAKVNGQIVPLAYRLKSGDIVEIITQKGHKPSQDWLKVVKTARARNKINHFLRVEQRENDIALGKEMLERELKRANLNPAEAMRSEKFAAAMKHFGFGSIDDLLAGIGYGKASAQQIITRLLPPEEASVRSVQLSEVGQWKREESRSAPKPLEESVRVKGVEGLLVRFAQCCRPVPGDQIIGFITVSKGVSVHRIDCRNLLSMSDLMDRRIEVEWNLAANEPVLVDVRVEAFDRDHLLADMLEAIAETDTTINAASGKAIKNGRAICDFRLLIKNTEHLDKVITKLEKIKGVTKTYRHETA